MIYTGQALDTLLWCSNQDAYTDEYGAEGVVEKGGGVNWSLLAYAALLEDVRDQWQSESYDWDAETEAEAL